jgi:ubiquitin C-terminal hydrolase
MQMSSSMIWCYECDAELLDTDKTSESYRAILQGYRECIRPGQKADAKPTGSGASPVVSPASKRLTNDARMPMLVLYPATAGLTGLGNLGNTCFFNAAVQALSNVPPLATFFSEVSFASQQVRQDSVANAFKLLMMDVWYRSHHGVSSKADTMDLPSLAPSGLLRALKQANPIFEGYQQQDAHEALRTLLNEMHEKLAVEVPIGLYQRGSRGGSVSTADPSPYSVTSDVGVGSKRRIPRGEHEKVDSDDSEEEGRQTKAGRTSQRRRHSRSGVSQHELPEDNHGPKWLVEGPYTGPETVQRSIISDLFQGIYCSRVRCSVCHTDSLTYDTFYDLSLPIPRYQHDLSRGSDGSAHSARAMAWAAEASRDAESYPEGFDLHQSSPRTGVTVSNAMRRVVEDTPSQNDTSAAPSAEGAAEPPSNWFVSALSKVFCAIRGPGRGFGFGEGLGLADCLFSFFDWWVCVNLTLPKHHTGPAFCLQCREDLKGADQYFCETCNKKQDAIKKISIVSLPEVLCIHLKRFSYHGWNGELIQLWSFVDLCTTRKIMQAQRIRLALRSLCLDSTFRLF